MDCSRVAEWASCTVCTKRFVPRFSYQTATDGGSRRHYCSISCKAGASSRAAEHCAVCGRQFELAYAHQIVQVASHRKLVCSTACRDAAVPAAEPATPRRARVVAVLNQKGGTGKTTTAVSLAAGLAQRGRQVLLTDLDAQGNVAVSLGLKARKTVYHLLVDGAAPDSLVCQGRPGLDVIVADQSLAAAEIDLVQARDRAQVLRQRMEPALASYDTIVLDCGPSLSLLNQNALMMAGEVLIPVSCDYLALVGVRQILRTLQHVQDVLLHRVEVLGVLPTLFDARNRISHQSVEALQGYFGERVLPPVRVNSKLKEAPSHKQTIFEYAPDSHGAADYAQVVDWVLARDPREVPTEAPAAAAPVTVRTAEART